MEVAGQVLSLPGVLALGVIVGLVAGMFGVGGGFLLTPLLVIIFRVPMAVAVGTGLCQMVSTATAASLRHRKLGQGERRFDLLMMAGSFVGVATGAKVIAELKAAGDVAFFGKTVPLVSVTLQLVYIVFLLFVAGVMWRSGRGATETLEYVRRGPMARIRLPPLVDLPRLPLSGVSALVVAYVGVMMGFLSGLLGIGGGVALMPVMLYGFGFPMRQAAGTGILVLLASACFGTLLHAHQGNVHLGLAMVLSIGASVSAQVGALLTNKLPTRRLRQAFSFVVVFTVVAIFWDLFGRSA